MAIRQDAQRVSALGCLAIIRCPYLPEGSESDYITDSSGRQSSSSEEKIP
jgi:hypothetical protein